MSCISIRAVAHVAFYRVDGRESENVKDGKLHCFRAIDRDK